MGFIRFLKERKLTVFALLAGALICAGLFLPSHLFAVKKQVLQGNTPDVVNLAEHRKSAQPQRTMRIVIGLKLRNVDELERLLAAQSDPQSQQFRVFLTPDQFTERFGPTRQDVDQVVSYFQSEGLTVLAVAPNRLLVELGGTVEALERAFSVKISEYDLKGVSGFDDGTYLSNDRDPTIPSSLAPVIESVSGLSEFARFHSRVQSVDGSNVNGSAARSLEPHGSNGAVDSNSVIKTPRNPGTPTGFLPKDIATVYNFPTSLNSNASVKYSGKGRTIAVATAYGYKVSDVYYFWYHNKINRGGKLTNVYIGGKPSQDHVETTLDLQTVSAHAPDADIMMYIGADPQFTTFTKVFNTIVTDNKADVVSISWGLCEKGTGTAQMKTEQAIFRQGVAQGMAFFAASGDDGAYDCKTETPPTYRVNYPSSDPNVTAVGGTTLYTNSDGSRWSETAWTGSGGGNSHHWSRPWWQTGPGVPNWSNRMTADVSAVANPNTGYAFFSEGKWVQLGGTSVSAPDWAALWSLALEASGKRLGSPLPTLYRLARSTHYGNAFYDVTSGNNGHGKGPGYLAKAGWDQPTGFGTPNGTEVVNWVAQEAQAASKP